MEKKMEVHEMLPTGTDAMPRERLMSRGVAALSDVELLSVIVGSGTKGNGVRKIAERLLSLLDRTGGDAEIEELMTIAGIGRAKGAQIAAAFELARRMLYPARHRIRNPGDVMPLISHYGDRNQEHFLGISLNGANEVIRVRVVTVGILNRTIVHPREVFVGPLEDRAAALIVAHNHPSGSLDPSPEDHDITSRLRQAGEILGITLLDHVIFSTGNYYSFLEDGVM
jgi:DNA repair protein RadC